MQINSISRSAELAKKYKHKLVMGEADKDVHRHKDCRQYVYEVA